MSSAGEYSRPQETAFRLGADAPDRHRFLDKKVLLTGEASMLATGNGRRCLIDSLLLLPRICRNVVVAVPRELEQLAAECTSIGSRTGPGVGAEVIAGNIDFSTFDAILSVGTSARSELPWTVINSNGWLLRVSSNGTSLPADVNQENPIACLAAASLGVSEVFKRLARVKESRGRTIDGLTFSLYSYSSTEHPGPALPELLSLDLVLFGVGAIGNGIVHVLSVLPTSGKILIVDPQTFGPENIGTCLLIGPSHIGQPKALFAEHVLAQRLKAEGYAEHVFSFSKRLGSQLEYPKIVLNGLDNIQARHEVQDLWPDLIIDGAISDFGCQVSRHPWEEDIACLKCLFREGATQPAEHVASRATGLSERRTLQDSSVVTTEDVEAAPEEKKEWLKARVGKTMCSVVSEAVMSEISDQKLAERFDPSVPFVACFSAAMVVAEVTKHICHLPTPLEPRFQFDVLRGPAKGQQLPERRHAGCVCAARKKNIETIRQRRFSTTSSCNFRG